VVAELHKKICGFFCCSFQLGTFALFVNPEHLHAGIGKRLFSCYQRIAMECGIKQLSFDSSRNAVAFYEKCVSEGKKTVVIAMDENAQNFDKERFYNAGKTYEDYARKLFSLLRKSDDDGYDVVIAQGVEEKGIGSSIANRLEKACGGKFI
jgi:L-threonylcarbamoyladenylate synthase